MIHGKTNSEMETVAAGEADPSQATSKNDPQTAAAADTPLSPGP
jgi:hypothetical protein